MGTGTSSPRLDRRGPCTLLRFGGTVAAVDLGGGALRGILQAGFSHRDLAALLLTHLHPDHVADLVSLLCAANFDDPPRRTPLLLVGGLGIRDLVGTLQSAHEGWLAPRGYVLDVREVVPGDEMALGAVRCRVGPVRHAASSVAYRFEVNGKSSVISGDTGPSAELEEFAREAHVLVTEATLPPGTAAETHLTPEQAGALARRARARELVLHHLTAASDSGSVHALAADAFGGPVAVAWDGWSVEV